MTYGLIKKVIAKGNYDKDELMDKLNYKKWFCGHYHLDYKNDIFKDFYVLYKSVISI